MMVTIVKLLIGISVALGSTLIYSGEPIQQNNKLIPANAINHITRDTKAKAFKILENKCNVCHQKRNRRRVFTIENMNSWANDINKQVFIKKRMPKGKKIKLTSQEYQDLLTWISSNKK